MSDANLFHSILLHLYKNHPLDDSMMNMNEFFTKDLGIPLDDMIRTSVIVNVLNFLKQKKFIEWGLSPIVLASATGLKDKDERLYPVISNMPINLQYRHVMVKLTLDGFNYISNHEKEEELHASQLTTNKTNRITGYAALGVSVVALGMSVLTFFKVESKTHEIKSLPTLTVQQSLLDSIGALRATFEEIRNDLQAIPKSLSDSAR